MIEKLYESYDDNNYFVKMDIEGGERAVIRGNVDF